jgi:uncharacterized protein (DUF1778 family)
MATFDTSAENSPLVFPLSPEQKRLLEEAAAIRGQSVPEFALSNLLPLAHEAIEQGGPTRLSARDRDLFLQLLDAPPEPNEALCRAAERYRERRG